MGANVTLSYANQVWNNGTWYQIITSPVTNIFGDLTYLIFGIIFFAMLWVKSENVLMTSILGAIYIAVVLHALPSDSQIPILLILALGFGTIMTRIFWRKD